VTAAGIFADGEAGPASAGESATTRDFTVAVFVVEGERFLLLWHRRLEKWLPPGGHIEPNELPDEAAVREVREETGILVRLIGRPVEPTDGSPRPLTRPAGMQLELIAPGHEHIDLIYFATPESADDEPSANAEVDQAAWHTVSEAEALGAPPDVLRWARQALASRTEVQRLAQAVDN
jgi:8-oxo-dGTP pyrophosphatase MutT (NUDIX family)